MLQVKSTFSFTSTEASAGIVNTALQFGTAVVSIHDTSKSHSSSAPLAQLTEPSASTKTTIVSPTELNDRPDRSPTPFPVPS